MRYMETIATIPPGTVQRIAERAPDCCANCIFFVPGASDPRNLKAPPQGLCRRYPPTAQITGMAPGLNGGPPQAHIARAFVPVVGPEWCGEHVRLQ